MRLPFGFSLIRQKAAVSSADAGLASLRTTSSGGWFPLIRESFTGAWQRNVVINQADVLTYSTVWACITLIASDIGKLWIKLLERDAAGIGTEITKGSTFLTVLRKPNHYQTRVKFFEHWIISKLVYGNTYVLKERDARGVVTSLYILDASRVQVLVAPDGAVYYALSEDYLSGVSSSQPAVPASEIIHDVMVPLYHPLVGVSPIHACGLAAVQGLKIQQQSAKLFEAGSQPSGVLTAPSSISDDVAKRIEQHWMDNYAGEQNVGRVAVLGDGLHYEPMVMTAVDAQLIDQLKWGAEAVCACFHVPGYMVGVGAPPPYTDIQSINLQYYAQALQNPIENLETLLDEGLELPTAPRELHVEFDLNALARMDSKTQTEVMKNRIGAGFMTPNQARAELDWQPVEGGDACYLQQQNFSLAALNRRDQAQPAPSASSPTMTTTPHSAAGPASKEFAHALFEKFAAVDWSEMADAA